MKTHPQTYEEEKLCKLLELKKCLRDLGWGLYPIAFSFGRSKGIEYHVIKSRDSNRRTKKMVQLMYDRLAVIEELASLMAHGLDEKVISGCLEEAPTVAAYFKMRDRLVEHGCSLDSQMDFGRRVIAYEVCIHELKLLFNDWVSVEHLVELLDKGNPSAAAKSTAETKPAAEEVIAK